LQHWTAAAVEVESAIALASQSLVLLVLSTPYLSRLLSLLVQQPWSLFFVNPFLLNLNTKLNLEKITSIKLNFNTRQFNKKRFSVLFF
jgi:hypothetical protein